MMSVNWKYIAIVALDVAIALYLVLAITVFNRPDEKATVCNEVKIDIAKGVTDGFLTTAEVKRLLEQKGLYPMAKPMHQVNTREIEETLAANPFIEQVECYKTQEGKIKVCISQRQPVLRVMANNGDNYYVDYHGEILPYTQYANNLIVATGWIDRRYARRVLAPLAGSLVSDRFWQNQTEQLNVLFDGSLELVPRVGNHVAYLGSPDNTERKLERLRKFYQYGLSVAGWNKYERVSVEFDNQIICKRRQKKS
jgi:cell division protein FtsQ